MAMLWIGRPDDPVGSEAALKKLLWTDKDLSFVESRRYGRIILPTLMLLLPVSLVRHAVLHRGAIDACPWVWRPGELMRVRFCGGRIEISASAPWTHDGHDAPRRAKGP